MKTVTQTYTSYNMNKYQALVKLPSLKTFLVGVSEEFETVPKAISMLVNMCCLETSLEVYSHILENSTLRVLGTMSVFFI